MARRTGRAGPRSRLNVERPRPIIHFMILVFLGYSPYSESSRKNWRTALIYDFRVVVVEFGHIVKSRYISASTQRYPDFLAFRAIFAAIWFIYHLEIVFRTVYILHWYFRPSPEVRNCESASGGPVDRTANTRSFGCGIEVIAEENVDEPFSDRERGKIPRTSQNVPTCRVMGRGERGISTHRLPFTMVWL